MVVLVDLGGGRLCSPLGTMVPSMTVPSRFRHSGKCKPSRPLPRVSIKHRRAVESDLVVVHVVRDVLDDLREEGWGRELGCALHIILHKDSMCNVECRQNLLACLMLIQGNEGTGLLHSAV